LLFQWDTAWAVERSETAHAVSRFAPTSPLSASSLALPPHDSLAPGDDAPA